MMDAGNFYLILFPAAHAVKGKLKCENGEILKYKINSTRRSKKIYKLLEVYGEWKASSFIVE